MNAQTPFSGTRPVGLGGYYQTITLAIGISLIPIDILEITVAASEANSKEKLYKEPIAS